MCAMRTLAIALGFALSIAMSAAGQNSRKVSSSADQSNSQPQVADKQSSRSATQDESSDHKTHVRLGGIGISGGYSSFSGYPGYYPYGPYYYPFGGLYASMLWDPFWGAYPPFYPAGYFGSGQGKGEVKLSTDPKNAAVYIDGGYAGTADHLKDIWLEPGAYELRVSAPDHDLFEQRIYVLSGKSLKIEARLADASKTGKGK